MNEAYPAMPVGDAVVALSQNNSLFFLLGAATQINNVITNSVGNNLTASEAQAIDAKLDDGNPLYGTILAVSGYDNTFSFVPAVSGASNCVNTSLNYNVANPSYANQKLCSLRIPAF